MCPMVHFSRCDCNLTWMTWPNQRLWVTELSTMADLHLREGWASDFPEQLDTAHCETVD